MERDELRKKSKMVREEAESKRGAERQHVAWVWAGSKQVFVFFFLLESEGPGPTKPVSN